MTAVVVLVRGGAEIGQWPLPLAGPPDLAVVDYLARLQLAAARRGCRIRVRQAPAGLADLLRLVGLARSVSGAGCGLVIDVGAEPVSDRCGSDAGDGPKGEPVAAPIVETADGQPLGVEAVRQPEGLEEPGVEEAVQRRDPIA
ncbi:MAG: hypothetical protein ACRDZ8_21850 [Acidimicrobiales bacterium]